MVARDVDGPESARSVTPMAEIRRHKGMLLEVFTHINPGWQWSEKRREQLMHDDQGRCWVPMYSPEDELYIDYDPLLTPEAEEGLVELSRRAMEEVKAGKYYTLDELDDEDDDLQCELESF